MLLADTVWFASTGIALGLTGGLAAGPLTALVISQTLRFGLKEGLAVSWAPVLTDGPLLLAGALLMHQLQDVSQAMGIISAAGSAFLLWLAWDCIKGSVSEVDATPDEVPGSIRKALLTNILNPHPYLFWFAVGGPLVAQAWTTDLSCVLGFLVGFFGGLVGSKMGIALLTHKLGKFMKGRIYQAVMIFLGLSIVLCAIYFAVEAVGHFGLEFNTSKTPGT